MILLLLAVLLGTPFLLRPSVAPPPADSRQLIIISPHNEQIRSEFGHAFDDWHQRHFGGQRVSVIWNVPGGTSEIRRMLMAQYSVALRASPDLADFRGTADLVFGGGSFEFDLLKKGVTITVDGRARSTSILQPVDLDPQWLSDTYGENRIGDGRLYDPDRHWFGAALSGFGIVFNRDVLRRLNVTEPRQWEDLCVPRLRGWVALVNPAQSGSITTAFETILSHRGWTDGWRILHRAAANAHSFSASSLKAPIEVSQGQAAAGICIDFYGRFQSHAIHLSGGGDRVGYVDPPGQTSIDADPVAMLRGARDPELARRFIEFCLSDEGQALWQFPARPDRTDGGMGPRQFELRRLPILRRMYDRYSDQFIDRVNPHELARPAAHADGNMRPFIAPLFAAMAMDLHHELRAAWEAIVTHPAYPQGHAIVTAGDVDDPILRRLLELFDEVPSAAGPDGSMLSLADVGNLSAIREAWSTPGLWPVEARPEQITQRRFTEFYRRRYEQIVNLARQR